MSTTEYRMSYIQAIKMTDKLFPSKKQKDYHEKYWGYLFDEFEEKLRLLNPTFTEKDIKDFMEDFDTEFELFFINLVGHDERMFKTPLRPRSIDAQLFLSQIKFYVPNRLMMNPEGYNLLQQKGQEGNAFENLGDLEEIREHITKANIHDYVEEVLSSALKKEYLGEVENPVFAQDILLHFGLSPIYYDKDPGYVQDVVDIIERRVKELEGTWGYVGSHEYMMLPDIVSADKMTELFSGVTDEITEFVWSICKRYIDELIGKRYVLSMNGKDKKDV